MLLQCVLILSLCIEPDVGNSGTIHVSLDAQYDTDISECLAGNFIAEYHSL